MSQKQDESANIQEDYCRDNLDPGMVEKLEAGAFRQLCRHLQQRSSAVANMELMTLAGFCRNCLAKWMVVEARKLVDDDDEQQLPQHVQQALNALGYEEAAQHVYGMTYAQWKARHVKKATDEQMALYKASEPLHAKHDKALLATRSDKPSSTSTNNVVGVVGTEKASAPSGGAGLSNVCCQDVEDVVKASQTTTRNKDARTIDGPYQPPPLPALDRTVRVAVLTVSDRAFRKEYAAGDLSGPAVVNAVQRMLLSQVQVLPVVIVPDDSLAIQQQLRSWVQGDGDDGLAADLIFTTGGTGMAVRDITPEATRAVVDVEMPGLMSFVATECSRMQPLSSLTRGTAGILNQSLVANLPGNPKAVGEIMPILIPLLLHAWQDMHAGGR